MFIYLYHLIWSVGILLALPFALLRRRGRFAERLSPKLPQLRGGGCIWIHALSVGEVLSAVSLAKRVKTRFPERTVAFTAATAQGVAVARKELKGEVDHIGVMPLDFWWSVRRLVRALDPALFILVETDLWPGLLTSLKKRGVKRVLVNGRVSPRTFRSYRRCAYFAKRMYEAFELCLMQSDLDRDRLLEIGVSPERVLTVGNLKFDHDWKPMREEERRRWLERLHFSGGDAVWAAGSTHDGEDDMVLRAHKRVSGVYPSLRLVIAPRRIEASPSIFQRSNAMGFKTALRTEAEKLKAPSDVLILDTLGELERIYGLSEISFVGGSLVPVGGHNLLEPAAFGKPVLFGPYVQNFVSMSERLASCGGGWKVEDEEDLCRKLEALLKDPGLREEMGRRAEGFVKANQGALERVLGRLSSLLKETSRAGGSPHFRG